MELVILLGGLAFFPLVAMLDPDCGHDPQSWPLRRNR